MAQSKPVSLPMSRTVFMLGLGSRGARASLPGTVTLDASKVSAEINAMIYEHGADILLRQASQIAEKEQIAEWKKRPGNEKRDPPAIRVFPFDLERLRVRALQAMEERVQDWYNGDPGREGRPMNAIDRRAASLVEAGLRAAYQKRKLALPDNDQLNKLVQDVLADPAKGEKYRAQAIQQLELERQAASAVGDDLEALLPAEKPKKASAA